MERRFVVTGGAGFIGSNFVRFVLDREDDIDVTTIDALTYAGVASTVAELDDHPRHTFVRGDIRDARLLDGVLRPGDLVVNFAAETHVDRSIAAATVFVDTNVVGTQVLIDAALRVGVSRFLHVSTDEVYGSIASGSADEQTRLDPSSPYAASKAGSDLLVRAAMKTHGLPAIITRASNNYGPYQHPEKLIPRFITNLIDGHHVPLYGTGTNQRDWLHVADHCTALYLLVEAGALGEIYNIGADRHVSNLDLTRDILGAFGLDDRWIDFVTDRPGHDLRYAVDSTKLRALGWAPSHDLDDWLGKTIDWYRAREDWWRPLKAPAS